ncbi:hypothetical protein T4E_7857 [Trichinella pseudospiralis]|uniref:Uncharacterized protein n=1 Tax=Trichinella pseudospiralis TaxID=6337 RepID=A0A0V0XRP9_TRIPS|nr:hypothetical protein T4E_7857 [Trichinella pseudospiralis]
MSFETESFALPCGPGRPGVPSTPGSPGSPCGPGNPLGPGGPGGPTGPGIRMCSKLLLEVGEEVNDHLYLGGQDYQDDQEHQDVHLVLLYISGNVITQERTATVLKATAQKATGLKERLVDSSLCPCIFSPATVNVELDLC